MRKRVFKISSLCVVIFFSCIIALKAQDYYSVASISPEMIKNADAVVRLQEETFTINSISSASYNIREIVTILNEDALHMSVYFGSEDKFHTYHFGKITIYNKDGKKVKSFGTGELKPWTSSSGTNIYDDVFYEYVDPEYMIYPFTAEITFSISYNETFDLPDWSYYSAYNVSVEKSTFTVSVPSDYKLRYFEQNITKKAEILTSAKNTTYKWSIENIPALETEPFSVSLEKYSPAVFLAPSDFLYGGKKGNTETWKNYGSFVEILNNGRDILPEETQLKVREIASSTNDTIAIIKKLYKYMQDKTRFVSIQKGIGGLQPIEAEKVDKTSYGDCKALSNYMKALLKIAGIKSFATDIKAGEDEDNIYEDFPFNQFNHVILCVPYRSDTIWLECTSQRKPFNYLGSFTDDRECILITEKGGVKIHTQVYKSEQNLYANKALVTIDNAGNGTASIVTKYSYLFFDNRWSMLYLDNENQKKALTNSIDIPGFTLTSFSFKQPDVDKPVMYEELSLKLTKYATLLGDRILLPVNLMNRIDRLPSNAADRKMDIEFKRERMLIDTIIYSLPSGYAAASVPQPMEYSSPFASYRAEVINKGNEIIYVRKIRYNKGIYPASQYPQLLEFNKNVATADNTKIALKKL